MKIDEADYWVDNYLGCDSNLGTFDKPLKSISEACRRIRSKKETEKTIVVKPMPKMGKK